MILDLVPASLPLVSWGFSPLTFTQALGQLAAQGKTHNTQILSTYLHYKQRTAQRSCGLERIRIFWGPLSLIILCLTDSKGHLGKRYPWWIVSCGPSPLCCQDPWIFHSPLQNPHVSNISSLSPGSQRVSLMSACLFQFLTLPPPFSFAPHWFVSHFLRVKTMWMNFLWPISYRCA